MKKIAFIGAYDKTDLLLYIAKIFQTVGKRMLVVDSTILQKAKYIVPITSKKSGYITKLPAKDIGEMACYLGAGRINKEDKIKPIKILCFLIFPIFKIDKIKHNPHIITIDKNIIFINLNNIIEKL